MSELPKTKTMKVKIHQIIILYRVKKRRMVKMLTNYKQRYCIYKQSKNNQNLAFTFCYKYKNEANDNIIWATYMLCKRAN